ncbi:ribonuclease 3-like protein 2 isoform X2 [Bidens hawaiensis]|uniref:ribonuclease 3-like protein 2 isoform X2 n=1 Tax=Bidens hawaiensis TaxID=980011 RepID=UPI00404B7B98
MVEEEEDVVVYGGVMRAPKVLVDVVESVAGAVFVDCGFNLQMLWTIFRSLLEPLVMLDVVLAQPQPVSALYEAHGKQVDIQYRWNGERCIASVFVDDTFIASGSSETKENAKLHAAEAALSKLTKSKTSDASLQTNVDFNESTEIKDAKKILHELCDKKKLPKPTYNLILGSSKNWVPHMTKDSYRPLKLSFLIKFYV